MTVPTPPSDDPLGVALSQTEAELLEKLEEACAPAPASRDLSGESTVEIARLSDSLLAAARAAKDVVSLRKRRRERTRPVVDVSPSEAIREFVDTEGRKWRVWPVSPGAIRPGKADPSLGEFQEGWLAFETLDETARRRLPHFPTDWLTMPDEKLRELLRKAVEAPPRRAEIRPPKPTNDPPA
jgi:hypothetical protein